MRITQLRLAAIALAAIGLSGCATYDPYGYGYGGLSVGYGSGGYYDPYYGGYSPYGYGYGYSPYGYQSSYGYGYGYGSGYGSPFGWYDGFYYPGSGFYVYDSLRRPHRWSDSQRRYWSSRNTTGTIGTTGTVRQNWTGFTRDRTAGTRTVRVDRGSRVVTTRDQPTRFERTKEDRTSTLVPVRSRRDQRRQSD